MSDVNDTVANKDDATQLAATEQYRLTLEHFIVDTNGNKHKLEEPLFVNVIYDRTFGPAPYVINQMLDQLRYAVIERIDRE